MNNKEALKTFVKSGKIKKNQDANVFDLLRKYISAIENSFKYTCENTEDWKISTHSDKDHIYLTVKCKAKRKENERV